MSEVKPITVSPYSPPTKFSGVEREPPHESLVVALVQRWRAVLLVALVAGAISVPAVWFTIRPAYKVTSRVKIVPVVRPILFSDQDTDISRHYAVYVATEMAAMTSPSVINAALDLPEIASLPWVRTSVDPVSDIQDALSVESVKRTQLLAVSMVGQHPEDMARIVNGVLSTYLRRHEDRKRQWDETILESLRAEESQLEAKLEAKGVQLYQTAVDRGLGMAQESGMMLETWMSEVQGLLTQANKERALAEARLKSIKASDEGPDSAGVETADLRGLRDFVATDPELNSLQGQLQKAELSVLDDDRLGRGPSHPDVTGRNELIATLRDRIDERREAVAEAYRAEERRRLESEIREAQLSAQVFREELDKLMQQRVGVVGQKFEVENLLHEREQLEHALSQVRQKIWNVTVEQRRAARITIESLADAPKAPNIDNRPKYCAAAALMSLFLGLGAGLVRHRLDTSFRHPEQVTERLGMRVLGTVADVGPARPVDLVVDQRFSEPIRGISAALLADSTKSQRESGHSRLITSPTRGTGKSSMSMNLARSLAATGRKVLLVDGDNHGRGVTRRLDLSGKQGLRELLTGTATPDEVTCSDPGSSGLGGMNVIPAGAPDGPGMPGFGELVGRRGAQGRLKDLFKSYDEVIVDSPPVLAKSDTVILATLVDEVVLVLRADRSTREEAQDAQQDLAAVGARVVGVVLNAVNPKNTRRGYGYSYGYTYAHTEDEA
jgi:capsular exopolysaccharide synthesis family protein